MIKNILKNKLLVQPEGGSAMLTITEFGQYKKEEDWTDAFKKAIEALYKSRRRHTLCACGQLLHILFSLEAI